MKWQVHQETIQPKPWENITYERTPISPHLNFLVALETRWWLIFLPPLLLQVLIEPLQEQGTISKLSSTRNFLLT